MIERARLEPECSRSGDSFILQQRADDSAVRSIL